MEVEKRGSRGYRLSLEASETTLTFPTDMYLIDLGKRVILCDTHAGPLSMEPIKQFVEEKLGKREFVIFNSHAHWDHFWGNSAFSKDTLIISTKSAREVMEETWERQLTRNREEAQGNIEPRLPSLVFCEKIVLPEDGIEFFAAPGHTLDDACCLDCVDDVLFLGDLVELPFPQLAAPSPSLYRKTLEGLLLANHRVYVSSHSGVVTPSQIQENIDYLRLLEEGKPFWSDDPDEREGHLWNCKNMIVNDFKEQQRQKLGKSFSVESFYDGIDLKLSPEELESVLKKRFS